MGTSKQAATTVQNNDPWAPTAPHLQSIMSQAQGLQSSGAGTQQWGGPALAGLSGETSAGLGQMYGAAQNNIGNAAQPFQTAIGGLNNGGLNSSFNQPLNTLGDVSGGANRINTGGAYGALTGRSLTQNNQPNSVLGGLMSNPSVTTGGAFRDVANSAGGITAADQYLRDEFMGGKNNPYLQTVLDDQAARTANQVNSSISRMGRYGSFGHGDALARSITAANAPILAQSYENDQNRKLTAVNQIDSSRRAADATQLAGISGETGVQNQNFQNQYSAANALSGSNRADIAGALSALTGMTGVQGQNINNQMGAAGQQAGIYNQGIQNQQTWAGLSPQLNNLQYDPAQRMLGVGGVQDQRAQAELDNQRTLFEQLQQMPWAQLANYSGAVSGLSPLMANAGTRTSNSNQTNEMSGAQQFGLIANGLGSLFEALMGILDPYQFTGGFDGSLLGLLGGRLKYGFEDIAGMAKRGETVPGMGESGAFLLDALQKRLNNTMQAAGPGASPYDEAGFAGFHAPQQPQQQQDVPLPQARPQMSQSMTPQSFGGPSPLPQQATQAPAADAMAQAQPPGAQLPQPAPFGMGERLGLAAEGFFSANSPMQAVGNLVTGLTSGQRPGERVLFEQMTAARTALISGGMAPGQATAVAQVAARNPKLMEEILKPPANIEAAIARNMGGGGQSGNAFDVLSRLEQAKSHGKKVGDVTGETQATAQVNLDGTKADVQQTMETIQALRNHKGRNSLGWHGITANVPDAALRGSEAFNALKLEDRLKARVFTDQVKTMVGMGALSNAEGAKITDAVASLDRGLKKEEYDKTLDFIEGAIRNGVDKMSQKAGKQPPYGFEGTRVWQDVGPGVRIRQVK